MTTRFKVIFREEDCAGAGNQLLWEPGSPLSLRAVQISRNVETTESYLQVKVLNIAEKTIGEVHAEALVRYPGETTETLTLDDLDADVEPGDEYVFKAVRLSRADAVRADIRIRRIVYSDGEVWESAGSPIDVTPGERADLSQDYTSARSSFLVESGCNDADSAVYRAEDRGSYWVCACGQVNLAESCARCKVGKQAALDAENTDTLDDVIAKLRDAAEKVKQAERKEKNRDKHTAIIAIVAVVTIFAVIAIAPHALYFFDSLGGGNGGDGVYVVKKHSYVDYEGKDAIEEYEIDRHGNIAKLKQIKPEPATATYEYDNYGNWIKRTDGDGVSTRKVEKTDGDGQPVMITQTDKNGDKITYEIEWIAKDSLKSVTCDAPLANYSSKEMFGGIGRPQNLSWQIGGSKYMTRYGYNLDSDGKIVSRTATNFGGTATNSKDATTTKYEYDDNGNVVRKIENGKVTDEYEYVYVNDPSPAVAMKSNYFMGDVGF